MKRICFLGVLAFILGLCSCSKDDPDPEIVVKDTSTSYSLGYSSKSKVTVNFTSATEWSVESVPDGLTVTPTSGNSGTQAITVKPEDANETNETKSYSFTIVGGSGTNAVRTKVNFSQASVFTIDRTEYTASVKGDTVEVAFTFNDETEYTSETLPVMIAYDTTFKEMWATTASSGNSLPAEAKSEPVILEGVATRASSNSWIVTFEITPNTSTTERVGTFAFCVEDGSDTLYSIDLTMTQSGAEADKSTDYSEDKKVSTLQTHTQGQGIPVVLMGDGFIDKDIADGTYGKAMNQAYEYLFSIEPTKSLKDYFDVYAVTAVSKNNGIGGSNSTAFSCSYGGGTLIEGDEAKVLEYAKVAVDSVSNTFKFNNALFIVVLNDTKYAGTCYLYARVQECDPGYGQGYAIAFVPMTDASQHNGIGFEQVLHHEAIGHGFGKLSDEYTSDGNGTITSDDLKTLEAWHSYGFYWNVTTESDVTKSPWATMAADSHYTSENLGCYEGGYTYEKGVYRATESSIMLGNVGGFNAPSRELIYKHAMMIANGGTFSYNYDTFVGFDKPTWSSSSSNTTRAWQQAVEKDHFMPRLAKPVIRILRK